MTSQNQTYDVVVVGNGVLGLSLALTLARRGLTTALVGAPHRPMAATTAAGAMLGCFGEATDTMLRSAPGRHKHALAYRARDRWHDWLAELAEDSGTAPEQVLTADGTVVLLNSVGSPGVDDVNYAAVLAMLAEYEEPHEILDPAAIDWLDPDPLSRPMQAVLIPGEHAVDSGVLLTALSQAYQHAGGVEVADEVIRIDRTGPTLDGVTLVSGTRLASSRVVLATGARTQELLDTVPDVAERVPNMLSGLGLAALLRTAPGPAPRQVLRTPNRAFACGLHLVPRREGEVYVGATNNVEPAPSDSAVIREVLFLLNCATRQLRRDLWKAGLHRTLVGNRPVPADGYPLLGETDLAGLWLMTGTYRDGLHMSPLLAAELATRIMGGTGELDLDEFRPVRAPLQPEGREAIIETAVVHIMAAGFEYDWHVPVEWPDWVAGHLRPAITKFADELDDEYTPPAEILARARTTPALAKTLRDYYAASRANH